MQPEFSPVVWHHPDNEFLGFGYDVAASVAIRLAVAGTLTEIGRMATRKPTIVKPKLNQPPDKDRFHEMRDGLSVGAIGASIV